MKLKTALPIARRGDYLLNRDGARDYGEINDSAEIEARAVSGEDNLTRKRQGEKGRTF